MDKATLLAEQYADASELATRGEFNDEFTVEDRHPHEWVFDEMNPPRGADEGPTVLDLGCGPGSFWATNAGQIPDDWSPVLADFSRGMVERARDRLADGPVDPATTVADGEELPFAEDAVDVVLALQMLYHLPDRERAIRECHRVLEPDGRLYATTGHPENGRELFDLVSAVADGSVDSISGEFTAENGREQLATAFGRIERRWLRNEVRVDDPDALVAYALSLPLDDPALSAFDPDDAEALRDRAAERIREDGAVTWRKDMALFVAEP